MAVKYINLNLNLHPLKDEALVAALEDRVKRARINRSLFIRAALRVVLGIGSPDDKRLCNEDNNPAADSGT